MEKHNLYECPPAFLGGEQFDVLVERVGFKLERIVSWNHATACGEWCDQACSEWVVLLKGSAGLSFEGGSEILVLKPGDFVYLPAHVRHRVEWTQAESETVWLALHYQE